MGLIERILAAIAVAIALVFGGRYLGSRSVKKDIVVEDLREAQAVQVKVEEAHASNRADPRPVDERLRSKGRLRD